MQRAPLTKFAQSGERFSPSVKCFVRFLPDLIERLSELIHKLCLRLGETANMYEVDPAEKYDGPEFEEYCISEGQYLPASRDRTPCMTCPLFNLCQPGFEEQVRRIQQGENYSLTEGCAFPEGSLESENLFSGLTQEQIDFVKSKIPEI